MYRTLKVFIVVEGQVDKFVELRSGHILLCASCQSLAEGLVGAASATSILFHFFGLVVNLVVLDVQK